MRGHLEFSEQHTVPSVLLHVNYRGAKTEPPHALSCCEPGGSGALGGGEVGRGRQAQPSAVQN